MIHPALPPGLPSEMANLVGILRARAALHPRQTVFTFLRRNLDVERELTFEELDRRARAIAARIQAVAAPGDRLAILCPNDLHFIEAFMACQYAGTIPVPSPPLQRFHAIDRLQRVLESVAPTGVVTTTAVEERLISQKDRLPGLADLPRVAVDAISDAEAASWSEECAGAEPIAFLQFTSGSVSAPKGVKISHANVLHNLRLLQETFGYARDSRIASWLPFFHDWGLIGGLLQPIYSGIRSILFDPFVFVRRPAAWLEVVSRYGATASGAPNFAYDMCCEAIRPADCAGLDLRRWKIAIVGAEPVRSETLERFAVRFAPYGFSRECFFSSYGLAESTLAVCGGSREHAPASLTLERAALEAGRVELTSGQEQPSSRTFVSCGKPLLDQEVCIVDPETRNLMSAREIGEVWVAGPSVACGYWDEEEASCERFQATLAGSATGRVYLRTGDQGFLHEGELYLTGRIKDMMIVNGRNLYPEDVERIAGGAHAALRSGKGAAFSVEMDGTEQYIIAHEVESGGGWDAEAVIEVIRRSVTAALGIGPGAVVLVKAGGIPRTSSGKVRRQACKQMYLARDLPCGYT